LDVSSLLVITDVFAIATGTSRPHILTLAEEAEKAMKSLDRKALRREGLDEAKWVLIDFGDVVLHIFDAETRAYYDLERLWADADRLSPASSTA
jgi:ribosome-associated protein